MQLVNATWMSAGYTMGMRPDGRELVVVAVKGTFALPAPGGTPDAVPAPAADQAPLVTADVFTGEPGLSAPVWEADYPPRKPACDVLLNGSAYAPGGAPAEVVPVAMRVGPVQKSFNVVGDRVWKKGLFGVSATRPEPFVKMPISYDNAFGGLDDLHDDPAKHRAYAANHVGRGFYDKAPAAKVDGRPLPNTEEIGAPVRKPDGNYRPCAFGPVGRSWGPRPALAGTYDEHWQNNVFPFLPDDFDEAYHQAAPPDQQMPYPAGGEPVELANLTPGGFLAFALPTHAVDVEFNFRDGERRTERAVVDTVIIEPDRGRLVMCWRASTPLKKNIFDVTQVVVGRMPDGWYRARDQGKRYYGSLKQLVDARRD